MSEITMKTIESLPIVEEPAEGASLVGWNNGQTVRMPVDKIGGGAKGIVFTYAWPKGASSPSSVEPLGSAGGYSEVTCNYPFEEFLELFKSGAPIMFVDEYDQHVSSMAQGYWGEMSDEKSVQSLRFLEVSESSGSYAYLHFNTYNGDFYIEYSADDLYGYYENGGVDPV